MTSRERVRAMLEGRPVDRLPCMPITMMFAADHYGVPYLNYAMDSKYLVEGQVRMAEDFGLDYVNTMSDPACEAFDCGGAVSFFRDQPPALDETKALLTHKESLAALEIPDSRKPGRMNNRLHALSTYKERVGNELWIEGWVEGPVAEAADLRGINALMMDFYDDPGFVTDLFEVVLEMELRFAREQAAAGADAFGVGDAAASLVGPAIYEEFVLPYEKRLVDGLHALGTPVRLHICGNTRPIFHGMASLGCEHVDLDSAAPLDEARAVFGPDVALCGNMDPVRVLRDGTPDSVYVAVSQCHRDAGPRYIVGAGCEVPRDTPPENLRAMLRYGHESCP